ncbi:MAG: DUF1571 domain-containing protein [Fimbriiglobus sp.]
MKRFLTVAMLVSCLSSTWAVDPVVPAAYTPKPTETKSASVSKVEFTTTKLSDGTEILPKMLADSKAVLAKTRDYTGHIVRQEVVNGKLTPESIAELRVRMEPLCVNIKTVRPQNLMGEETSYLAAKNRLQVRFKPAGIEGVRGFQTLEATSDKVLANTRHPANEVGLSAMIERIEKILSTEKALKNPVQVFASDYMIGDKTVTRFEIITERAHPARYAAKCVVYIEKESKLPVRFEAYATTKPTPAEGELLEVQQYIGVKRNTGLGDRDFER